MFVHSVFLVDPIKEQTLGLIEQERWIREGTRGRRALRKKRAYESKESFKWQRASQKIADRLSEDMSRSD